MTHHLLPHPDDEPPGLQAARERQFLQLQPRLWGYAVGRLEWLLNDAGVWSDAEVAAYDARVAERMAELMA